MRKYRVCSAQKANKRNQLHVAFHKSVCFDTYRVKKTTKQVHKYLILFQTDILTFI
jgi:co-chaperonin GroES (HSP10)